LKTSGNKSGILRSEKQQHFNCVSQEIEKRTKTKRITEKNVENENDQLKPI